MAAAWRSRCAGRCDTGGGADAVGDDAGGLRDTEVGLVGLGVPAVTQDGGGQARCGEVFLGRPVFGRQTRVLTSTAGADVGDGEPRRRRRHRWRPGVAPGSRRPTSLPEMRNTSSAPCSGAASVDASSRSMVKVATPASASSARRSGLRPRRGSGRRPHRGPAVRRW